MKIFIIILATLTLTLATLVDDECEACLYGTCHYREKIQDAPDYLSLVNVHAVDYTKKIIYCEFLSDNFRTFIGYWENKSLQNFRFTDKLYSVTVDQNTHDVYVSSLDDKFKFNPNIKSRTTDLINKLKGIKCLQFHKDTLYFSYSDTLYKLVNTTFESVFQNYPLADFVVDKNNDVYFRNRITETIYKFNSNTLENNYFCNENFKLSVDKNGDVYLNTDKILYKIVNQQPVDIGHFSFSKDFRPVFDWDNNIVFVDLDKLYVLKPSNSSCVIRNGEITQVCSKKCEGEGMLCMIVC